MKKIVKSILAGLMVLIIIGVIVYSIMKPIDADVLVIEPSRAHVYFTERGYVEDDKIVVIYPE